MAILASERTLDARLWRAAEAILQHGEPIEIEFTDPAGIRGKWLVRGRAKSAGHVRLCVWCESSCRIEIARFSDVTLPQEALERLEAVAVAQEKPTITRERRQAACSCQPVQLAFGERYLFPTPDEESRQAKMLLLAEVVAKVTARHAAKDTRRDLSGRYAGHSCERAAR